MQYRYLIEIIKIISLLLLIYTAKYSIAENNTILQISNPYLKIMVSKKNGGFTIVTTGGHPDYLSDNNVPLLYYKDNKDFTSFSSIKIDGVVQRVENQNGNHLRFNKIVKGTIVSKWSIHHNIEVIRKLIFIKGKYSLNPDTVEIFYNIINRDYLPHTIGFRLVLDTYLATEDGVPFFIPDSKEIKREKLLIGNNIPPYWYSFDNLLNPSVMVQGTLRSEDSSPDKIIFASWERFKDNSWLFKVNTNKNFRRSLLGPGDSAVGIFWNSEKVSPHENRIIKTYYGIYSASIYKLPLLNISLQIPPEISETPFLINLDIQNVSQKIIKNMSIKLLFDSYIVTLLNKESCIRNIVWIEKKQTKHIIWKLISTKMKGGEIPFSIVIDYYINKKHFKKVLKCKTEYKGEVIPLDIDLIVSPSIFTPDGDGENDLLKILPLSFNEKKIKKWRINIYQENRKEILMSYSGTNLPEEPFIWNGTNCSNKRIESEQRYKVELIVNSYFGEEKRVIKYFETGIFLLKTSYGLKIRLTNIEFEFNSDKLRESAFPILQKIIKILNRYKNYKVKIVGYTDNRGNKLFNLRLSKKRARSVYTYLVQNGIPPSRLRIEGKGEAEPIASNDTEVGRKRNRRVEFLLFK